LISWTFIKQDDLRFICGISGRWITLTLRGIALCCIIIHIRGLQKNKNKKTKMKKDLLKTSFAFLAVFALIAGLAITSSEVAFAQYGGGGGGGGTSYVADTTPPTNTSISIAAGEANTSTTAVTLTLAATDAVQMMISNNSDFSGASWESYSTSKTWTLTSGNGNKTVYAKFRDSALNSSTAVSDTIALSNAATPATPAVPGVTPAVPATPAHEVVIPALPSSPTTTDIQTVLVKVAEQVAYIQANLTATNALALLMDVAQRLVQIQGVIGSTTSAVANALAKPLHTGSQNADVNTLQAFLKSQGSEIYPEGLVTGYFGAKTEAAVGRFQVKNGLVTGAEDPAYGYVGPATRAKINSLLGL
jgi:peptidoglycan hydrolase-like protein with peptidoglycan-binding domain